MESHVESSLKTITLFALFSIVMAGLYSMGHQVGGIQTQVKNLHYRIEKLETNLNAKNEKLDAKIGRLENKLDGRIDKIQRR
jgi:outer membrane murein-binding lipoprotein Lpp